MSYILTIALSGVITFYTLELTTKAWAWIRFARKAYPRAKWRRRGLLTAAFAAALFFLSCILVHLLNGASHGGCSALNAERPYVTA